MLSSVLRSKRAIRVNVEIMRAFVRLRQLIASHADLAANSRSGYDAQFRIVFMPSVHQVPTGRGSRSRTPGRLFIDFNSRGRRL